MDKESRRKLGRGRVDFTLSKPCGGQGKAGQGKVGLGKTGHGLGRTGLWKAKKNV